MWAAPELLYPKLYPDLKVEATLNSDIYSFGSIMFFVRYIKPFVSVLRVHNQVGRVDHFWETPMGQ